MKKRVLLCRAIFLLAIFLTQCSNKKSGENSGPIDSVQATTSTEITPTVDTPNPPAEEKTLTIKGKEIWVRHAPTNGDVVLKLNDGDHCKILKQGYFEVIRGEGDFWININFNGTEGWVFGSQTDASANLFNLKANSTDELWKKFVAFSRKSAAEYNESMKRQEDESWTLDQDEVGTPVAETPNRLVYTDWHGGGGQSSYDFGIKKITENFTILAFRMATEGATGFYTQNCFIPIFKGQGGYSLQLVNTPPYMISFEGVPDTIVAVEPNKKVLITKFDERSGVMIAQTSYAIYSIDENQGTLQRVQRAMGLIEFGAYAYNDATEGKVILDDIKLELAGGTPFQLKLIQNGKIRKGTEWAELTEPVVDVYQWDKQTRKFIKK